MLTNTTVFNRNGILYADDIQIDEAAVKNKIIIRNLFTLTATEKEAWYVPGMPVLGEMPGHFGYTSVGRIEFNQNEAPECRPGELVLIPAFFQSYLLLSVQEYRRLKQILYLRIPKGADPVMMLFYPMMCAGSRLCERVGAGRTVYFHGCHMPGFFLLQLLEKKGKELYVWLGARDLKPGILMEYDIHVLDVPPDPCMLQTMDVVMEFEDKSGGSIAGRETTGGYQKEHKRRPWNNRFVLEQFLHSISCQDMEYEKLADYHVHAESLDFVNRFLNCGASYERIFIYDW